VRLRNNIIFAKSHTSQEGWKEGESEHVLTAIRMQPHTRPQREPERQCVQERPESRAPVAGVFVGEAPAGQKAVVASTAAVVGSASSSSARSLFSSNSPRSRNSGAVFGSAPLPFPSALLYMLAYDGALAVSSAFFCSAARSSASSSSRLAASVALRNGIVSAAGSLPCCAVTHFPSPSRDAARKAFNLSSSRSHSEYDVEDMTSYVIKLIHAHRTMPSIQDAR
jgi:hypothetical protein